MMKKGEVTVFLSLIFILLITFCAGILEVSSIEVSKNIRRADTNRAMESVFAEYRQELLEDYDVFGLEATYESGDYSEDNLSQRLEYYGSGSGTKEISRIQFLTDDDGQAFYDQIVYYMEAKYGLNSIPGISSILSTFKGQEKKIQSYTKKDSSASKKLDAALEKAGGSLSGDGNPVASISSLKNSPILDQVMPKSMNLSSKSLTLSELVSHRSLNEGFGDFSEESEGSGVLSKALFSEYLLEHFSYASMKEEDKKLDDCENETPLDYELEYLYAGKASDQENLEAVVKKLLMIRFVANYSFLVSNSEKRNEAEALAASLALLLASPEVEKALTAAILLAWGYGESVVDIRSLLKGNKVPLKKTNSSWQLSLSGLMRLGEGGEGSDGKDNSSGLSYQEYLRMLLLLKEEKTIRMRALDIIEKNLQIAEDLSFFKADYCVSRLEIESTCDFRRGITYTFPTYFGYN